MVVVTLPKIAYCVPMKSLGPWGTYGHPSIYLEVHKAEKTGKGKMTGKGEMTTKLAATSVNKYMFHSNLGFPNQHVHDYTTQN